MDREEEQQEEAESEGFDGWELEQYFSSYGALNLQREMVSDAARNRAYRAALDANCRDRVVLDVGCGTGLLSILAARAGASRVYGVEASGMAWYAHQVVVGLGLQDRVHITQQRVELLELGEAVDVVVSEWMGAALLFEGMLDAVLGARDRYAAAGARVTLLPDSAALFAAPVDLTSLLQRECGFWRDVSGVDMSPIADVVHQAMLARPVHQHGIQEDALLVRHERLFKRFDLNVTAVEDLERIDSGLLGFDLACGGRQRVMHGVALWFDVGFPNVAERLSTSPRAAPTHWHQELLLLDAPLAVEDGDFLELEICIERNTYWRRHYLITVRGRVARGKGVVLGEFAKEFAHHRKRTARTYGEGQGERERTATTN